MIPRQPDVEANVAAVLERPDGSAQDASLAGACAGDATLRRRVDALLAGQSEADDLDGPSISPTAAHADEPLTEAHGTDGCPRPPRRPDPAAADASVNDHGPGATIELQTPATTVLVDRAATRRPDEVVVPGAVLRYFGDYEIRRELGRGAMGVVYEARQASLDRPVALKMIRAGLLAGDDELRRFRNEAQDVALLDHPGIVPVFEVGRHQGQDYFTMKLVPGSSLVPLLSRYKDDPRAAARLLRAAADAVAHARAACSTAT
jgi:hypothetical protein